MWLHFGYDVTALPVVYSLLPGLGENCRQPQVTCIYSWMITTREHLGPDYRQPLHRPVSIGSQARLFPAHNKCCVIWARLERHVRGKHLRHAFEACIGGTQKVDA